MTSVTEPKYIFAGLRSATQHVGGARSSFTRMNTLIYSLQNLIKSQVPCLSWSPAGEEKHRVMALGWKEQLSRPLAREKL